MVAVFLLVGSVPGQAADAVVARSGKTVLTEAGIRDLLSGLSDTNRATLVDDPAAMSQFVRDRLVWLATLDAARAAKWNDKADIAAQAEQAKNDVIVRSYLASRSQPEAAYPNDAEIEAAYEANKSRFLVPRQYRLAQILLTGAAPDGATSSSAGDPAKRLSDLRAEIQAGKLDFATAARQSEDKAGAAKGGLLEWLPEDKLLPEIRNAVQGLAKDEVSEPVKVQQIWNLLQLVDTKPASVLALADVRDQLLDALREQRAMVRARNYLADMLKKNPVQIDEIRLSTLVKK